MYFDPSDVLLNFICILLMLFDEPVMLYSHLLPYNLPINTCIISTKYFWDYILLITPYRIHHTTSVW